MSPDSMEALYKAKTAEARGSVWGIRLRFIGIFLVLLVLPLALQFVFFLYLQGAAASLENMQIVLGGFDLQVLKSSQEAATALGIFVLTTGTSIILLAIVLGASWYEILSFQIAVWRKRVRRLSPAALSLLNGEISTLCGEMGIEASRLVLWMTADRAMTPSVIESRGRIHLIMPLGFIWFATRDPEACGAMIAHEFGHVLQSDTRLWRTAIAGAAVVRRIVVPLSLTALVLGMFFFRLDVPPGRGFNNFDTFAAACLGLVVGSAYNMAGLSLCWWTYLYINRVRLRSETMADMAAIIYAGSSALSRSLDILQPTAEALDEFPVHLQRNERLEWIRRFAKDGTDTITDSSAAGNKLAWKVARSVAIIAIGTIGSWAVMLALDSSHT